MVANGVALLGLTLKFPPYFGPAASTDPGTLMQSSANRLRCAVDIGVLWVYVCSLAATLLYVKSSGGKHANKASRAAVAAAMTQ